MALFGKNESAATPRGGQAPNSRREVPAEQQKTVPKSKANARTRTNAVQTTYLGKNLKINGNLSGKGSLIVLGTFEGAFDIEGRMEVTQGAVIKGDVQATDVSINGNLEGTIVASERIVLDTAATIKGRLVTPKISIQDGAVFDGELRMSPDPEPEAPESG